MAVKYKETSGEVFVIRDGCLQKYRGDGGDVTVPDGVREIGRGAFEECEIESVVIPDSVERIGWGAFSGCKRLTRVQMGNGVRCIRCYAFMGCDALREVTLSERLSTVGFWAFFWCDALRSVQAPASLSSKKWAWWENFLDHAQVYMVAFSCFGIESPAVRRARTEPETALRALLKYGMSAAVPKLLSLWRRVPRDVLDRLLACADEAGSVECSAILMEYAERVYPREVRRRLEQEEMEKEMGLRPLSVADWRKRFRYSVNEKNEITLLEYIGEECEVIMLPTRIGRRRVTAVRVETLFRKPWFSAALCVDADNEVFSTVDGSLYTKDGHTLLMYAASGREREFTPRQGVRRIGENAFIRGKGLEEVVLPEGVRWIGESAFSGCSRLVRITLPSTLQTVGAYAFLGCSGLSHVTLPARLSGIGRNAFYLCSRLEDLYIPDSVGRIGEEAFAGCERLARVYLGHGLATLEQQVFQKCEALRAVTVCRGTSTLHWGAFWDCPDSMEILFEGTREEWGRIERLCADEEGREARVVFLGEA